MNTYKVDVTSKNAISKIKDALNNASIVFAFEVNSMGNRDVLTIQTDGAYIDYSTYGAGKMERFLTKLAPELDRDYAADVAEMIEGLK